MLYFLQNNPCSFGIDDTSVKTVKMKWNTSEIPPAYANQAWQLTASNIHPDIIISPFTSVNNGVEIQSLTGDTTVVFEFTLEIDSSVSGILNEYVDYIITATPIDE